MVKTLITTKYHILEGEWGNAVREFYLSRGYKGNRDVMFHEIQDSTVKTGADCVESQEEVKRVIEKGGFRLWIDLHCVDFPKEPTKLDYLDYRSRNIKLREGLRKRLNSECFGYSINFDGYLVRSDPPFGPRGIPIARIETQFKTSDLKTKGKNFQMALDHTCRLINLVHDFHEDFKGERK